jgi:TolB-like protein
MINVEERNRLLLNAKVKSEQIVTLGRPANKTENQPQLTGSNSQGLFHLISELHRRRVCRAATLYAIAMWLTCQIVQLVYLELGLPAWTLKFVIVVGLVGFPITLILSWLFDITPNGIEVDTVRSRPQSIASEVERRTISENVIDCALIITALVISFQLTVGVLSIGNVAAAAESSAQRIAVVPFRVASGVDADLLSDGLLIELQHELIRQTGMTVIAPTDQSLTSDSISLTGYVSIGENQVRVTATMIDNTTGAITWSQAFQRPRIDSLQTPVIFAQEIVAALPVPIRISSSTAVDHAT